MKDKLIALVLGIIMTLNFFDVIADISLGVPVWHIVEESIIVLVSAIGTIYLVIDIRARTLAIAQLKAKILVSDKQLHNISAEMMKERQHYGEVISGQFTQWNLSESERQVALLLLKGLSFKEISEVRNTKEKTVRQQASHIYSKANLEGRHEFAAWFLEDFLAPKV